jgi:beta-galactosidase
MLREMKLARRPLPWRTEPADTNAPRLRRISLTRTRQRTECIRMAKSILVRNPTRRWTYYVVVLVLLQSATPHLWAERTEIDLSGPGWRLLQDKDAPWENDALFLPSVQLSKLPTNPPTNGWKSLTEKTGISVSIPGTAEEYLGDGGGPSSDVKGVTWWYRQVQIPAEKSHRRMLLEFESARQRAEIYIDGKLVGYDVVGNSPFEVDLTDMGLAGKTAQLAVRITDPGGNFDWTDFGQLKWGKYTLPMNHGFCGITGRVKLVMVDDVYCADLYVQNTPAMSDVNMLLTVHNGGRSAVQRDLKVDVLDGQTVVASKRFPARDLPLGESTMTVPVSVPGATLWDTNNPKLYTARVTLVAGHLVTDEVEKRFGFRWFTVDGIGTNAVFHLNGKRVFLKTAISWGYWPTNGMFATPEMADKQIRSAKSLGLNMLNFHRCIGSPVVMEKADELGLLYFEEPGSYVAGGTDAFAQAICHEKLLRMVKRDRSHPSLIIYNMINEQWNQYSADKDDALFAIHEADLKQAHQLDPSRIILYTSAWADAGKEQRAKLHMLPFDEQLYSLGWLDSHRATGPETWLQEYYVDPPHSIGACDDVSEIVYRGEEGAISAPPQLEKIHAELQKLPRPGWDGAVYEKWYEDFAAFLDRKHLRESFPTVDAFTCAMGAVSLEHQGRRIQAQRIGNIVDGYAVNGWEAEVIDNHSGIVDCFRNPKADPAIMARYLQPLYVAVMPRSQVLHMGSELFVDFYAVNEQKVRGAHTLSIAASDGRGAQVFAKNLQVKLAGGDTFGQLLAEAVQVPSTGAPGMWTITAKLLDSDGKTIASGDDDILLIDWKSDPITGIGAVYERKPRVRDFLSNSKGLQVPAYRDDLGKLDWVVVTVPCHPDPDLIPASALRDSTGKREGLTKVFYSGQDFDQQLSSTTDATVDLDIPAGGTPDPKVGLTQNYSIRWTGSVVAPKTGPYTFAAGGDDGVRLWINDSMVIDDWSIHEYREHTSLPIQMEAGKPVRLKLDFFQGDGGAKCMLKWVPPTTEEVDPEKLFQRAANDGTTLLFLERPETWLDLITKHTHVTSQGTFTVGTDWLGGQFFARKHPLLEGLPVDCAMNWPYQRVVRRGATRFGMRLEGEELVAGAYQSWPMALGTAIGLINCGKGRIILSSLDICGALEDSDSAAEVARKMLCNYIRFASQHGEK